jgi:hypothetical protein
MRAPSRMRWREIGARANYACSFLKVDFAVLARTRKGVGFRIGLECIVQLPTGIRCLATSAASAGLSVEFT